MRRHLPLFALLAVSLLASAVLHAASSIPVYGYTVVRSFPHDTGAYTEGLFYQDGFLYESTGELGQSSVRKVDLDSGETVQRHNLPAQYFGEGIVSWGGRLIQLTWKSGTGFVYAQDNFQLQTTFTYPGEGWALTRDDHHIYMSDGSSVLRVLDPQSLQATGSIMVTADGKPVSSLNELEWVDGEIYANVWLTNRIARIDPRTGQVIGWIDLDGLLDISQLPEPGNDVLNGIAYDARHRRLFVTGKRWPKLFEITLKRKSN